MRLIELRTLVEQVATQPFGVGVFMAFAGVVFLLLGHRISKTLVAISFFGVGFFIGATLGHSGLKAVLLGLVVGLAMGAVGAVFVRAGVAVLAGGWCTLLALQLGSQFDVPELISWGIGVITFAGAVSLTFIAYDEIVAFVTSLEGTFMCIGAIVIFGARSPAMWAHLQALLMSNLFFGPFLVLTGTVTGYFLQLADIRHKHSGTQL